MDIKEKSMSNGWEKWGTHVLEEMKRLNINYERINKQITIIREDIAALKVKSGVWGTIGGVITVAIYIAFQYIMGGHK